MKQVHFNRLSANIRTYDVRQQDLQPLMMMHVPKCAGVSLRNSLIDALGCKAVLWGYDRCMYGDFREITSVSEEIRRSIYLEQLPEGEFEFVGGHIGLTSLRARYPRARLITVMREPRIRLISYFCHWRSASDEVLASWGDYASRIRLSHGRLSNFLFQDSIANHIDNVFARFLLYPHRDIPDDDFIDHRLHGILYREAKKKLNDFQFIDVLENPHLGNNLAMWLGLPFRLRWDHDTGVRDDLKSDLAEEFSEATHRRLRTLTAIDSRLWAIYARRIRGVFRRSRWADGLLTTYVQEVVRRWRPPDN